MLAEDSLLCCSSGGSVQDEAGVSTTSPEGSRDCSRPLLLARRHRWIMALGRVHMGLFSASVAMRRNVCPKGIELSSNTSLAILLERLSASTNHLAAFAELPGNRATRWMAKLK